MLVECGSMNIRTRRIVHPHADAWSWTLLSGVIGLWLAAGILIPTRAGARLPGIWLPSCPLRSLTGIPCPFCGITTGCAWLAHGDLRAAWNSNILSPILMLGSLVLGGYVFAFRILAGRAIDLSPGTGAKRTFWILAASLAAASWIINFFRY